MQHFLMSHWRKVTLAQTCHPAVGPWHQYRIAYGDDPEVPPGIIWLPESLSAQLLEDMYHDAVEELDDEEPKNFN